MAIPVIYKGDDTDFRGSTGFTLKVVTSSTPNLSGCTVEVEVLGFRRSFPASATGELVCPFAFTAAETQRMPLGIHAATVRVYDSKGRVRTINNSIRVKVTNSVHEAYGKDDPQEVTLAVSTVDLEAYAKKDEVSAAIAKAMKDAGASVKLHALTPEVADTTVMLAPVDGAANYVDGKVTGITETVGPIKGVLDGYINCEIYSSPDYEGDSYWLMLRCEIPQDAWRLSTFDEGNSYFTLMFNTTKDIGLYDGETRVGYIPEGRRVEVCIYKDYEPDYSRSASGTFDCGLYVEGELEISSGSLGWTETDSAYTQSVDFIPAKSPTVVLPESTDAAKARRFSLAVETDAESEKDVTWQGGEVVEAVPGASKLVPGLNVWDVSEVAPGKFRVDRASSPAQSAPLTLTAPNGRVAELAVDDDLVLEVKEI